MRRTEQWRSLLDGITEIIEHPASIISLLGVSIPKTGTFFTTFVMLRCEIGCFYSFYLPLSLALLQSH